MLTRAYSLLEVKTLDEERRVISGWATTPDLDRGGDTIDPFGVIAASDIPLLLYHDSTKPVGRAKLGKATSKGVPFDAWLPKISEPGLLRDRVEEAWAAVKHRLITGVSVGFRALPDKVDQLRGGGRNFRAIEVMELSLVPIPANASAVIESVKAADAKFSKGPSMNRSGAINVRVDTKLRLIVEDDPAAPGAKTIGAQLTRMQAQQLADALQQYSGLLNRSHERGSFTDLVCEKAAVPSTTSRKAGVIYVDSRKPGVVHLNQNKGTRDAVYLDKSSGTVRLAQKKSGVVFLDDNNTARSRVIQVGKPSKGR